MVMPRWLLVLALLAGCVPAWARPGAGEVRIGSDPVPPVWLSWGVEPASPWVRQATRLTLEACAAGQLQWQRPQVPAGAGFLLRPLGETEVETTRDGMRCTATRWHWSLLPTAAGPLQIPLPVLQATRFGTPLRFPAPAVEVRAQPLPTWLPEDVPVGALAIEPAADAGPAIVGRPWPLRFVVTGEIAPRVLQELLQAQLPLGGPWSAYPPEIRPVPDGEAASRQEVTLYARPTQAGVLFTPALRLGWFDPDSGRIEHAQLPSRPIAVARAPLAAGWRWAAAAVFALLVALFARAAWRRWRWRLARWQLQRALRRPLDAARLHALVLGFDLSRSGATAGTLGAWQSRMERQCHSDGLPALVALLQALRYGGGADVQEAQAALRQWLRTLRPLRATR
jgi:hypothetical protein